MESTSTTATTPETPAVIAASTSAVVASVSEQSDASVSALANKESFMGRRIEKDDFYGTVRFSGPLTHTGRPNGSEKYLWLGIEWDDETRGRHNGTVNETVYFTTKDNKNSGTLVKYDKVNLGIDILDGILAKYFKENIPKDLKQTLQQQIDLKYDSSFGGGEKAKESAKKVDESGKTATDSSTAAAAAEGDSSAFSHSVRKMIQVEMDEDAYFETFKKHKKMVQFYGFDKIWDRLNNISELTEISLNKVKISDVGETNHLRRMLASMRILSLEDNLLFDWDQIFQIGNELPNLDSLSISFNRIRPLTESVRSRAQHSDENVRCLKCFSSDSLIAGVTPMNVFSYLRTLIVINCQINWQQVSCFLPAFPVLEELFLCQNDMTDFHNIDLRDEDLAKILVLNLESTNLSSIDGLKEHLPRFSNLQRLLLNKNRLTQLGQLPKGLDTITQLSLENNHIESSSIFSEVSQLQNLTYLNIKHNPIGEKLGKSYVRQRAVAEIPKLQIVNGSDLKKYERKDCEIYYLRRTFDDYFTLTSQVYYKYDLAQFVAWAAVNHPSHARLMKQYGNPYEQQPEPENITENSAPKNVMISLTLVAAAGPQLGKADKVKKFPDNTTVLSLKSVLSKLYGIPNDKLVIKYRVNKNDPNEILDEDHKAIGFYGVRDGSMLIIDQQE